MVRPRRTQCGCVHSRRFADARAALSNYATKLVDSSVVLLGAVFIAAGVTSFLISQIGVLSLSARYPIALRTASTAIWLAPLVAVLNQKSWSAIVLWVVFWMEVARLAAFLRTTSDNDGSDDQPVKMIFAFLVQT